MRQILNDLIVKAIPRVLSSIDRSPFSPTYGCFDRNYWHYKTVIDFPSATFQQSALFLAHLYTYNFKGNYLYNNQSILELSIAAIDFWTTLQNNDGSFNEWYPNEHSHVATAFTLYGISEALLVLKDHINQEKFSSYKHFLLKSAKWLSNNIDYEVINHTAGSVAALYNVYLITHDESILKDIDKNINIIIQNQSIEGWFKEYSGADIGYTFVSVDYLIKYFRKSSDQRLLNVIYKALRFLTYFVHPDASSGGEYGNRNTKYIMPAGLHIAAKFTEDARYLLERFYFGLNNKTQISLENFDDRYFLFFFAPNYIESLKLLKDLSDKDFSYDYKYYKEFSEIFSQAGILVKKTEDYYFVCNFKKGGVSKLFDNSGKLLYSDCSYYITYKNKQIVTSQFLNPDLTYYIDNSEDNLLELKIEVPTIIVDTSLPLTKFLIPFRIINKTLCKSPVFAKYFGQFIKKKKISKPKISSIIVKRHWKLNKNTLIIEDAIFKPDFSEISKIYLPTTASSLHVPSSKYSQINDYINNSELDPNFVNELNKVKVTYIKSEIKIKENNE